MDAEDWEDLASVFQVGADMARGWVMNIDRKQEAQILEAQADKCREIGRRRAGLPRVIHLHSHVHDTPDGGRRHKHPHEHAAGQEHHGHGHDPADDPARDRRSPLFPPG